MIRASRILAQSQAKIADSQGDTTPKAPKVPPPSTTTGTRSKESPGTVIYRTGGSVVSEPSQSEPIPVVTNRVYDTTLWTDGDSARALERILRASIAQMGQLGPGRCMG